MMFQMLRSWTWLQRSQWFKHERLRRILDKRLKVMVTHAYDEVPFYRSLYDESGINPRAVPSVETLGRLPAITKQQIQDTSLNDRMAVGTNVESCIVRTTSGSTGRPITFLDDAYSASYRAALWLRRFWAFGVRPLDRAMVVVPGEHRRSMFSETGGSLGFLVRRKVRRLSLAEDVRDHIRIIASWKPDVLVGPPSYFRTLMRASEETQQSVSVRIAQACGEMLDGATRKLIGDRLGAEVFETYGVSEAGGIAWECPTHIGLHLNTDSSIIEFLRDGEHVGNGETGELCVTNLWRKPTPMIRYMVGDMATYLDDECSCGRGLALMKNIQGRTVDFIVTSDGRSVSPFRVMFMLEDVEGLAQYKVIQQREGSIEVLARISGVDSDLPVRMLKARCADLFGDSPVTIRPVEKIDIPKGGKFRVVESRLAK